MKFVFQLSLNFFSNFPVVRSGRCRCCSLLGAGTGNSKDVSSYTYYNLQIILLVILYQVHRKTICICISAITVTFLNFCCYERITCGKANSANSSSNTSDLCGEVAANVYVLTTKIHQNLSQMQ